MTRGAHLAWRTARDSADADAWLDIERFEYVRLGEHLAVVRLLAGLGAELRPPTAAMLVLEAGPDTAIYAARGCRLEHTRRPQALGGEFVWRGFFAVRLDLVEYPRRDSSSSPPT